MTAKTSDNRTATALNASHYLVQAAVEIEKLTNGREADQAPGPSLPLGSPVIWSYVVTNTGNVPLTNVSVSDSRGVAVSCPKTTLALGETMICTAAGTVSPGQYSNTGTVNASPPTGSNATASDPSHYFGQGDENAGLHLEKLTNNEDADLPPGPTISVGSFVRWIYRVTNNGQVVLTDIVVSDDRGVFISCPKTSLGPGESMDCTASGTSIEGQYRNLGTVKARSPSNRVIEDSDPSHYLGQVAQPAIDIQKSTNGEDADSAPGPVIPLGAPVTWTYVVTNSGNVTLNNVVVTDNKGIAVSCPQSTLAVGESMTCVASAFGVAGQYSNVGTATGSPTTGANVTDSDPSYYFGGVAGAIHIEKLTSGQDADSPPGPTIGVGDPVVWTHKVTNTGGRKLTDISVSDNKGVAVTCPAPTLDSGQSMTCTAAATAVAGQYANTGTATGKTSDNATVQDSDPSHYLGGGVTGSEEDGAPNSGDGNGDGIKDSTQNHVASLVSSAGQYMTMVVDPDCTLTEVDNLDAATLPPDTGSALKPQGLLGFNLKLGSGCSSPLLVTVLYFGETDLSQAEYRKYGPEPGNPTPHWYSLPATFGTASIGGNTVATVSFSVTDGGLGDKNVAAPDGIISDPGGPGLPAGTVTSVPTLSEVGIVALAMLLLAAGVRLLSRRQALTRRLP